jgi:signal transduction histidine kinase
MTTSMNSSNFMDILELHSKSEKLLEDLKDKKKRKRSIFTLLPIGFSVVTDTTCREIVHNPAAAEIFRINHWESSSFSSDIPPAFDIYQNGRRLSPEEMPLQRATWKGEVIEDAELSLVWRDGISKYIQMSCRPLFNKSGGIIGALGTVKDITELKALEEELTYTNTYLERLVRERTETILRMEREISRLSRLDLLGELAGSIGHEVRNPLTTVRGYLQLLQQNHKDYKHVYKTMIEEIDRANAIITKFLSVSKGSQQDFCENHLNNIIQTLFPLMEAKALMDDKTIKTDLGEIPSLYLDASQINQLILNLVNNGMDATPAGGTVTIRTYREQDDVILSVADEGSGIPPAYWGNIGKPFFTTKESGTGLGLSVCYTIARKHGARIDFTSSSNGTVFYVRFKA